MKKEQNNKVVEKEKVPTILQVLKLSGTPSHFTTQQQGGVPTFPFLEFQARKVLTFLVVVQMITLVAVHQFL